MATRVLVVDDSVTQRELLVSMLASDPGLEVVGQARTGAEAIRLAAELRPDIITMDIHMPVMNGLDATKQIMSTVPTPILIVTASSSGDDVNPSLDAISAGALMLVSKPRDPRAPGFESERAHLVSMVKSLAEVKVVRRSETPARGQRVQRSRAAYAPRGVTSADAPPTAVRTHRTQVVAMAASTGGPAALAQVLRGLPAEFAAPVLVVQHITIGFTEGLARWLDAACRLTVRVASHGEHATAGVVYLAPDGRQLGIRADGRLAISDEDDGGFRPSANHLFGSVARAFGGGVAAVVLTGMGSDGTAGLRAVHAAGGFVIAQDEPTSVVYGMPREAVNAGIVDRVLPLPDVAGLLLALVNP